MDSEAIICALAKTLRFNELQTEAGGVNPTTLSDRLSDLERLGIITKTIYSEVPPRTEYNLTQKGKDLLPVLKHMAVWGEKYFGKC
ncbi:helix-turn-helix transcriptional regulator [Candidatus Uhrbacteria bacterium]|nr:MAG: helix-turn-helix transcriptional regulator [Candidatus Uhrbacteria bacterium]